MLLADLDLTNLPLEALISLKHAVQDEVRKRRKANYIDRRLHTLEKISYRDFPFSQAFELVATHNSQSLLELPNDIKRTNVSMRLRYLEFILAQHWDGLFLNTSKTDQRFYVYAHVDPRLRTLALPGPLALILKGEPFYIGKGTDTRAYSLKRNEGHGKRIKQIRDAGFPDASIVQIICENLSEKQALILEAKLIYFFGSVYSDLINGCLLNLADHIQPVFTGVMQKIPARKLCLPG